MDDRQENATWVYTYDQGGNILSKKKYALGTTTGTVLESNTFTYGNAKWKDQLTAVNGKQITYDAIGNPLNDGTWTYTWEKGRQLKRMQSVDTDASFVYNEKGLRVQKTVNGVVTNYTLYGKDIMHMTRGSDELHFFYDVEGKPAIVVYNGTPYSYVKNLQGDIVAILNSAGTAVVNYVYDAWGYPISKKGSMASTLGTVQPFRYRGYVYDEETDLYYLRSRYFRPAWLRFLNMDSIMTSNIFSYCNNSPVCMADHTGREGTPQIHLYETNDLKYRLKIPVADVDNRMTNIEFAWVIRQMEHEKWKYDWKEVAGGMDYMSVDCVSVYRYAIKWYYWGYREFVPKNVYNVEQMIEHCCSALEPIQSDYSNLEIGMALFMQDDTGHHYHVGYYIGAGKVLESNYITENGKVVVNGVRIIVTAQ